MAIPYLYSPLGNKLPGLAFEIVYMLTIHDSLICYSQD